MAKKVSVKVLVVDDDPDFAVLIQDLLDDSSKANFRVDSVLTMAQGVASVEKNLYDVILLDYKLPDGNGLDFLTYANDNNLKVPVIIVTGHGAKEIQAEAVEAGAADYLSKGSLNADVLDRTCLYAIGLQIIRNDGAPGFDVLINLTNDAVKAQTILTTEIHGMRDDLKVLKDDYQKGLDNILDNIHGLAWGRWVLDWIKNNHSLALVIFFCLVFLTVLAAFLFQFIDVNKINALTTGFLTNPNGFLRWIN